MQAVTGGRPLHQMSFIDSIKSVLLMNYANFEGRAARSEYWWYYLFTILTGFCIGIVDGIILIAMDVPLDSPLWIISPLVTIFQLAILVPSLAVTVRRLHDIGKSGWYLLLIFIPLVGIILLIVWCCTDGELLPNAYGPPPTNTLERSF